MWEKLSAKMMLVAGIAVGAFVQEQTISAASLAEELPGEEGAVTLQEQEWSGEAALVHKDSPSWSGEEMVRQAIRLGRPLLPAAGEESVSEMDKSPALQISTEFLERLHLNPMKGGAVARSRLEMDPDTGGIGLRKLEMGFEGRGLWLIHTPSTDETEGSMGLELKLRW